MVVHVHVCTVSHYDSFFFCLLVIVVVNGPQSAKILQLQRGTIEVPMIYSQELHTVHWNYQHL